jgi:ABC-type bacteriocin/lantibiotic exporter with double-glycine peptidase domain
MSSFGSRCATIISIVLLFPNTLWAVDAIKDGRPPANVCGRNCVYALLKLMGRPTASTSVDAVVPVGDTGTNLQELQSALVQLEMPANVLRGDLPWLSRRTPAICLLRSQIGDSVQDANFMGHYVVVARMPATSGTIELIDGTSGKWQSMSIAEFRNLWTGYAVITTESESPWWVIPMVSGAIVLAWAVVWHTIQRNAVSEGGRRS